MAQVKTIAVDLAKSVFHLYGVDGRGHPVFRKRLTRGVNLPKLVPSEIGDSGVIVCRVLR
jgi:hypothetical protein